MLRAPLWRRSDSRNAALRCSETAPEQPTDGSSTLPLHVIITQACVQRPMLQSSSFSSSGFEFLVFLFLRSRSCDCFRNHCFLRNRFFYVCTYLGWLMIERKTLFGCWEVVPTCCRSCRPMNTTPHRRFAVAEGLRLSKAWRVVCSFGYFRVRALSLRDFSKTL